MGFADASRVRRVGAGRWAGEVQPGWDIAGNANGGYLLAIAARAMAAEVGRPDPVSITAHYLAPVRPAAVETRVDTVRAGKRFHTASAILAADDRARLAVLGTFADLTEMEGPERVDAEPTPMPAPDACVAVEPTDTFPPPFMGKVDLRLHPEDAGFVLGEPSGQPRMRGWFRFPDGEPVDSLGLLVAADAFPPTVFNARLPIAWTPTLELTVHLRLRPEPGWLRCAFATRFISSGFLEADGEVWDASGHLVAQSRQLALVPRDGA
ncbi:MAG: thioesterase family protein [Myxococcota bacterium]